MSIKRSATPEPEYIQTDSRKIDVWIQTAPTESQLKLKHLHKIIKETLPQADEVISYGMPTFKLNGQGIAAFAGYKHHIGFYPMSGSLLEQFQNDLIMYKTSKGAVQLPLDRPLPVTLIKKLVRARINEAQVVKKNSDTPKTKYVLRSKVWKYPGMAGWRFLTLPKAASATIKKAFGKRARGWGSLPVAVTIGKISWKTSIFPDKKAGAYLLPLKAEVRKREQIDDGDTVTFQIQMR